MNTALIEFYWDLGKMLSEMIKQSNWGDKVLENVSRDLRLEFSDMRGFSVSNLKTCKLFHEYFNNSSQLVNESQNTINEKDTNKKPINDEHILDADRQIPWGHIKVIITKIKDIQEAMFYLQKTKEHNWSKDILSIQIKSNLYERQGKGITNFTNTLPTLDSDLAQQTLKDPYIFDFLQLLL